MGNITPIPLLTPFLSHHPPPQDKTLFCQDSLWVAGWLLRLKTHNSRIGRFLDTSWLGTIYILMGHFETHEWCYSSLTLSILDWHCADDADYDLSLINDQLLGLMWPWYTTSIISHCHYRSSHHKRCSRRNYSCILNLNNSLNNAAEALINPLLMIIHVLG